MATVASGRSTEKFATLLTTSTLVRPSRNSSYSRSRSSTGVAPVSFGASRASASSSIWSRYWPITRMRSPSCLATSSRTTPQLRRGRRRQAVALVVGARRVLEPLLGGQVDAHLVAGGGGDEALGLDLLPRGVEALGADEREDVGLAAVLAHERRGQAEAAARLQLGGQLEDRGGQQVHLVVDDEAPVEGVEQREVGVLALPLRGEDLVRRDRDRLDLLDLTRVLADLVLGQGRALEQLAAPLPRAHGVGDEDQRGRVRLRHRAGADERLAGAAGQHDDAGAALEEVVDRLLLVVAQVPVVLDQVDLVRGAGRVAGVVLGGPAELQQLLLDLAARPGHAASTRWTCAGPRGTARPWGCG